MKNIRILFFLLIVCVVIYIILILPSLFSNEKRFSYEAKDNITKIVIQQDTTTVELLKNKNEAWLVDDKPVNDEVVARLLYNLSALRVSYPLPENQIKTATEKLLRSGYHIKVFDGKSKKLDFSVTELDSLCVGLVHNKTQPYVISTPGYPQSPLSVISSNAAFYMNNVIFKYLPSEIKSIAVENLRQPYLSYKIFQEENVNLMLFDLDKKEFVTTINTSNIQTYLTYFNHVEYEQILDVLPTERMAILALEPAYKISLQTKNELITVSLVNIPLDKEIEMFGQQYTFDTDKLYLLINNNKNIAIAKWVDFDILIKDLPYFVNNK